MIVLSPQSQTETLLLTTGAAGALLGTGAVGAIKAAHSVAGLLHVPMLALENVLPPRAARRLSIEGPRATSRWLAGIMPPRRSSCVAPSAWRPPGSLIVACRRSRVIRR